jgi:hypothetical protein
VPASSNVFRAWTGPTVARNGGGKMIECHSGKPLHRLGRLIPKQCHSLLLPTMASRHFMDFCEIACRSPAREFVNCFLREILTASDVDRFEPPLLAPPPHSAGRNADLLKPAIQTDDRARTVQIFAIFLHDSTLSRANEVAIVEVPCMIV